MRAVCSVFVPRAEVELAVGPRDAELAEEHRRQLVVVVLAGVHEQLLVALAQRARHRRGLDELRPVPDDREDLHPAIPATSRATEAAKASCAARVSGPGACGSAVPSTALTACTSRVVEARKASCAPSSSSSVTGRSTAGASSMTAPAGDRVQDVVVERRRDERRRVQRAEEGARRRLEHAAVRRDEQRLVAAALLGQARGQHVRGVGERLDAVEDPRRRVGHARQRHGLGVGRSAARRSRGGARRG